MLDQVKEGFLAPVDVLEDECEQPLARRLLERLADGPRNLLRRGLDLRLSEQRVDRGRSPLVGREDVELL